MWSQWSPRPPTAPWAAAALASVVATGGRCSSPRLRPGSCSSAATLRSAMVWSRPWRGRTTKSWTVW
eukprot:879553-Alexandrium_andersonii.AAC.1